MKKKFAFVLWNPKTRKVSWDILLANNAKEALEACLRIYVNNGTWILSMCEIPT